MFLFLINALASDVLDPSVGVKPLLFQMLLRLLLLLQVIFLLHVGVEVI